jgi:tetratricopeptide (TPR) repeat protein
MKQFCAVLFLVCVLASPRAAFADDLTDCYAAQLGKRIAPCSAVIDNPASTDYDRQQALETRSVDLSIERRFAEALSDVNKALEINPNSAVALNGRAWTLFRWKNTDEGMADVERSLKLNGTLAPAWDTRAHLFQLQGQFDKAFKDYESAIGFGGEPFIRTYQCGLRARGHYKGQIDGIYSPDMRAALRACAFTKSCDPLPDNEFEQDCENIVS